MIKDALLHHPPTIPRVPSPLNTFIATTPSSELILGSCPTDVYTAECALTKAILPAYDVAAPLRKFTLFSRHKPWVNLPVRALMLLLFDAATLNAYYAATIICLPPVSERDFDDIVDQPFGMNRNTQAVADWACSERSFNSTRKQWAEPTRKLRDAKGLHMHLEAT